MSAEQAGNHPFGERWRRARMALLLVCGIYACVSAFVYLALRRGLVTGPTRGLVGSLPSLVFLALIVTLVVAVRNAGDEWIKKVHLQAATFAFIVTVLAMEIMDLLARAGVWNAARGDLELPALLSWAGAIVILGWRSRC